MSGDLRQVVNAGNCFLELLGHGCQLIHAGIHALLQKAHPLPVLVVKVPEYATGVVCLRVLKCSQTNLYHPEIDQRWNVDVVYVELFGQHCH